ncbi:hypothetical protein Taro_019363 [Colocasia esculenta]|uniref:Uncharacterized protein n=1 Tax=Colocasia esculenta TaxID=4460 RepID=A0A843UW51_COLES|nr:hypothetical protein [Colocasia esculenta]
MSSSQGNSTHVVITIRGVQRFGSVRQSLKQIHEDRVHCVDTVPGSVDTRPSLQKTHLPDWDSVSTQPVSVSTLEPVSRTSFCANWDSSSCSSCCLSRRDQFGVVVLRLLFEPSCSVCESLNSRLFGVVVLRHWVCRHNVPIPRKEVLETGSSVDTLTGCVDTLSQSGKQVFWRLGLVSTLPGTVSTQ